MGDQQDRGTAVDPTDTEAVRRHLERFAGTEAVETTADGGLRATFGSRTHVTVAPDGHVETGMPLHAFSGVPDELRFDHERGELHVRRAEGDESAMAYVFRRP